jgi:hypothetical protein
MHNIIKLKKQINTHTEPGPPVVLFEYLQCL